MAANKKKTAKTVSTTSISKANTLEQVGEFWDTHDLTDYDNPRTSDIGFTVTPSVSVDEQLLDMLEKQAHRRGVKVETLVNLWLQQRLAEESKSTA